MLHLKNSYLLIVLCLCISACDSGLPDIRAIRTNNQTAKKFKDQSLEESQNGFLQAMRLEPFQEEIHLNLGTTYEVLKDQDKALRLYKNAEELYSQKKPIFSQEVFQFLNPHHSKMLLFIAYFNQAQLLARENRIDEALEKYQQALGINPDSKEVKTNIELLLMQKQQEKNQQGNGDSDNKDQNNEDQKNQEGKNDPKDGDDEDQNQDNNQDKKKDYSTSPKYKPREFKGELNKESVQKIFGEISQQEKKMRSQFSKQSQSKESPRDKDW